MMKATTVDEYISGFPLHIQDILTEIRKTILLSTNEVVESISYGMPAYKLHGNPVVYFAAFKNHIGFYATPQGHTQFSKELSKYKQGKGSVQFPLHENIPLNLIIRIVQFKVKEIKKNKDH